MKSGFVSIIGRPNVGKSSLINSLVGEKIAIISDKVQTTRNNIQGIYSDEETQIVFIDTPGIHKPINRLGKMLNKKAHEGFYDVDLILFVVDASENIGTGDRMIINNLTHKEIPTILILNKIDLISKEMILLKIDEYKDLYNFAEIIPASALKNDNIEHVIKTIRKYLKDDIRYFDSSVKTSNSKHFMISEFVREKILLLTEEEVPHSVTCVTTKYEEKKNIINISVDIIIDRESIKGIIIGKNGEKIKKIGALARMDIEKMLGKQIYLELYVKTILRWRDKERILQDLGLKEE